VLLGVDVDRDDPSTLSAMSLSSTRVARHGAQNALENCTRVARLTNSIRCPRRQSAPSPSARRTGHL